VALRDAPAVYKPHALASIRALCSRSQVRPIENMFAQIAKLVLDLDSKGHRIRARLQHHHPRRNR